MTPAWLINRLRLMSAPEILHRVRQKLAARYEKHELAAGSVPHSPAPVVTASRMAGPEVLLLLDDYPESDLCSRLTQGKLSLFGYHDLDINWPINWHRDPLTGVNCPAHAFGKEIDYRDDSLVGDIKVVWELGRQQYLVPLAIAYGRQRDPGVLAAITGIIDSWVEQNPYGYGIHWCSSLEVAIRGMSWSFCHQFLLAAGEEDGLFSLPLDQERLRQSIYQHAAFIRAHLSLYSSANNHLIGELTGLHTLCTLFSFGDRSALWAEFAWTSLQAESQKQVFPDGVNKEQAIYYHCWVLEYFIINFLLVSHADRDCPQEFADVIGQMAQFIHDLGPMLEGPPQIGDADDGTALVFATTATPLYRDMLETVQCLAGAETEQQAGIKARCYAALLGDPSSPLPCAIAATCYPKIYPEGGYGLMGDANTHLVFDCGPLGYPAIAAHGHADMLSICLAIDGHWWIVDPGTYSYHSDHAWRDYFRGSSAHNVLCVNSRDQSIIGGPFMWIKHANAHFKDVEVVGSRQKVSGWHDGYLAVGVPRVERTVEFDSAGYRFEVIDTVFAQRNVEIAVQYHFSPDIYCIEQAGSSILLGREGTTRALRIELPPEFSVAIYRGDTETKFGWYSSGLGLKQECLTLRAVLRVSNDATWSTVLSIEETGKG